MISYSFGRPETKLIHSPHDPAVPATVEYSAHHPRNTLSHVQCDLIIKATKNKLKFRSAGNWLRPIHHSKASRMYDTYGTYHECPHQNCTHLKRFPKERTNASHHGSACVRHRQQVLIIWAGVCSAAKIMKINTLISVATCQFVTTVYVHRTIRTRQQARTGKIFVSNNHVQSGSLVIASC